MDQISGLDPIFRFQLDLIRLAAALQYAPVCATPESKQLEELLELTSLKELGWLYAQRLV